MEGPSQAGRMLIGGCVAKSLCLSLCPNQGDQSLNHGPPHLVSTNHKCTGRALNNKNVFTHEVQCFFPEMFTALLPVISVTGQSPWPSEIYILLSFNLLNTKKHIICRKQRLRAS